MGMRVMRRLDDSRAKGFLFHLVGVNQSFSDILFWGDSTFRKFDQARPYRRGTHMTPSELKLYYE